MTPKEVDAQEQEQEQQQQAKSSPLSLHFDIMSCEFATPHFSKDAILPSYTFRPPCVEGKAQPDQECRLCPHHRVIRVGGGDTTGQHRYMHHGLVVPLTEAQAAHILETLELQGARPLTRPHWQSANKEAEKERLNADARHAAAREMERRQSSPYSQPIHREQ